MTDNEFWARFWMMAFTTLAVIVTVATVTATITEPTEEPLTVQEMKVLLDSGYVKKEIGCDKPVYSFIKDTK